MAGLIVFFFLFSRAYFYSVYTIRSPLSIISCTGLYLNAKGYNDGSVTTGLMGLISLLTKHVIHCIYLPSQWW